jgi:hypothetical protein
VTCVTFAEVFPASAKPAASARKAEASQGKIRLSGEQFLCLQSPDTACASLRRQGTQALEHAQAIASLAPGMLNTKSENVIPASGINRMSARQSWDFLFGSKGATSVTPSPGHARTSPRPPNWPTAEPTRAERRSDSERPLEDHLLLGAHRDGGLAAQHTAGICESHEDAINAG